MARHHDTIVIRSGGGMPSLGNLIGSRVSHEVFGSINDNGHASFFGSDFDNMRQEFFDRYVSPMDTLSLEISKTVNALINPDRMRILNTIEDFRSIPLSMEMPILLFEPVRRGVEEGRFYGFGYDAGSLPPEDVYGRLLDNFTCEDVAAASDDEGYYSVKGILQSDDPELTDDELWAIARTRDYIRDKLLRDTERDPTDIDSSAG